MPVKHYYLLLLSAFVGKSLFSQTAITAVTTSNSSATGSFSYVNGGNTYNWGLAPNNNVVNLNGFTAGGLSYSYASFLNGTVRIRRVNNANISGNFTLVWAESVTNGTIFNLLPAYQNDMEGFFNSRTYNKGTDNLFDNISFNSNNKWHAVH